MATRGDIELATRGEFFMATHRIFDTRGNDYAYRTFLTHEQWASVLAEMGRSIEYTNFKAEIDRIHGAERHRVYSRVWSVLLDGLGAIERQRRPHPPGGVRPVQQGHRNWPRSASPGVPGTDKSTD